MGRGFLWAFQANTNSVKFFNSLIHQLPQAFTKRCEKQGGSCAVWLGCWKSFPCISYPELLHTLCQSSWLHLLTSAPSSFGSAFNVTPLVFQMSDFGIRNMDQVAPVSNMYRGMLKVSTLELAPPKPSWGSSQPVLLLCSCSARAGVG